MSSFWWSYFFNPIPTIIGDLICSAFIPKLRGYDISGKVECDLFFACSIGWIAARQHTCSQHTSSPLVYVIVSQIHDTSSCIVDQV